jgi:hypothetical protein
MKRTELLGATQEAIDALTAVQLKALDAEIGAAESEAKAQREYLNLILDRRFGTAIQNELDFQGKDTGTIYVPASNSIELKVEIPKNVKWDQPTITKALEGLAPADAKHYAKVEITVEEAKFASAPPAIKAALLPARTVKPGKRKFTFRTIKEAA